jgi:hypothetical protein
MEHGDLDGDVQLDRCRRCPGIWFDRGELADALTVDASDEVVATAPPVAAAIDPRVVAARRAADEVGSSLAFLSMLVLGWLFLLLFVVGAATVAVAGLSAWWSFAMALALLLVQYLIGPWMVELVFRIRFTQWDVLDPRVARFVGETCAAHGIRPPRLGIIEDGNPSAFTYGHRPPRLRPDDRRRGGAAAALHVLRHAAGHREERQG